MRFMWTSTIYFIWQKRNFGKHLGIERTPENIFHFIVAVVGSRFAFTIANNSNRALCENLGIIQQS